MKTYYDWASDVISTYDADEYIEFREKLFAVKKNSLSIPSELSFMSLANISFDSNNTFTIDGFNIDGLNQNEYNCNLWD